MAPALRLSLTRPALLWCCIAHIGVCILSVKAAPLGTPAVPATTGLDGDGGMEVFSQHPLRRQLSGRLFTWDLDASGRHVVHALIGSGVLPDNGPVEVRFAEPAAGGGGVALRARANDGFAFATPAVRFTGQWVSGWPAVPSSITNVSIPHRATPGDDDLQLGFGCVLAAVRAPVLAAPFLCFTAILSIVGGSCAPGFRCTRFRAQSHCDLFAPTTMLVLIVLSGVGHRFTATCLTCSAVHCVRWVGVTQRGLRSSTAPCGAVH
jgi:hypothetical protein